MRTNANAANFIFEDSKILFEPRENFLNAAAPIA